MRIATLSAVAMLALPTIAHADVWQDRVVYPEPGQAQLTTSSKVLYLNDCLPNGCNVIASQSNSSINNTSSIANQNTTLSAYAHGQAHWDEVIQCVKETMAPFDIDVTTTDPGTASHYEVMIGGTATQLRAGLEAGGIAPFISCDAARNNVLVFVFAGQTSDKNYLCAAIAHEAGHAYGLSHSLDAKDPMTYMDLGARKHWQNSNFQCGTESPEPCRCTGSTQNQFRILQQTWGLSPSITAPSITLATPKDGQWVKPGFPVTAIFDSQLSQLNGLLAVDGAMVAMVEQEPLAFNTPALPAGDHTVAISATDFADRTVSASATVKVMASCSAGTACAAGFHCLGGLCLPDSSVDGGLGAACTGNDDCITGSCGNDGESGYCTAQCDEGQSCPAGFSCLDGANMCWPEDSGGCSTSNGSTGFAVLGFGVIVLVIRRRRRSA